MPPSSRKPSFTPHLDNSILPVHGPDTTRSAVAADRSSENAIGSNAPLDNATPAPMPRRSARIREERDRCLSLKATASKDTVTIPKGKAATPNTQGAISPSLTKINNKSNNILGNGAESDENTSQSRSNHLTKSHSRRQDRGRLGKSHQIEDEALSIEDKATPNEGQNVQISPVQVHVDSYVSSDAVHHSISETRLQRDTNRSSSPVPGFRSFRNVIASKLAPGTDEELIDVLAWNRFLNDLRAPAPRYPQDSEDDHETADNGKLNLATSGAMVGCVRAMDGTKGTSMTKTTRQLTVEDVLRRIGDVQYLYSLARPIRGGPNTDKHAQVDDALDRSSDEKSSTEQSTGEGPSGRKRKRDATAEPEEELPTNLRRSTRRRRHVKRE